MGTRISQHWLAVVTTLALPGIALGAGLAFDLAPTDDAYITFRSAVNLESGNGLVYNPGERVEATSAFGFAVALAALLVAGIPPQVASVGISILGLLLIGWWMWREGIFICGPQKGIAFSAMAISATVLSIGPVYHAWTGMETVWCSALTLSGLLLFYRRTSVRSPLTAGLCFGIAAATRMECIGIMFAAVLSTAFATGRPRRWRDNILIIAATSSVFSPVLFIRIAFFGNALPNTYYAKLDGGSIALSLRGLAYVIDFLVQNLSVTLAIGAGTIRLFLYPAHRERTALWLGAIGSQLAFCVLVGGDWFPFHRFAVPIVPIAALLLADLCWTGLSANRQCEPLPRVPWLFAALVLCLFTLSAISHPRNFRLAYRQQQSTSRMATLGQALRSSTSEDTTLLVAAAGALPFFSDRTAHDFYGLTDPVVAHTSRSLGKGLPGHEKFAPDEQIRRLQPDIVFLDFLGRIGGKRTMGKSQKIKASSAALALQQTAAANGYELGTLKLDRQRVFVAVKSTSMGSIQGFKTMKREPLEKRHKVVRED